MLVTPTFKVSDLRTSLFTLSALLLLPTICSAQKAVIVVRHAERDGQTDALTAEGKKRAESLARVLKDAGVTAVVHSDTNRARDTAGPLAAAQKITPRIAKANAQHIDAAFKQISASGDDAVVLYVGHSDTVGPILQRFGYTGTVKFDEDPWGQLFVITPKSPTPVVIKLHYPKD